VAGCGRLLLSSPPGAMPADMLQELQAGNRARALPAMPGLHCRFTKRRVKGAVASKEGAVAEITKEGSQCLRAVFKCIQPTKVLSHFVAIRSLRGVVPVYAFERAMSSR